MSFFKKIQLAVLLVIITVTYSTAQIGINANGADPDTSALLDISSTSKGILIPRMSSTERENIGNPATGLMVFDMTTNSFWFFSTTWREVTGRDAQNLSVTQDSILIENGDGIAVSSLRNLNETGLQYVDTLVEAGLDVVQELSNSNRLNLTAMYQSFTPTKTGKLTQIDLRVLSSGAFNQGDLRVFEGGDTTGILIYQGVVDSMATPWHNFDLSNEQIYLTAGVRYTFSIRETTGSGSFALKCRTNNPYPGGNTELGGIDYTFKTYYETVPVIQSIIETNLVAADPITVGISISKVDTLFFVDGTYQITAPTDKQTIDTLRLDGTLLELSLKGDGQGSEMVDLNGFMDNTDDQKIDLFSLVNDNLQLSLESDEDTPKTVNLSSYKDNTDDQKIDVFNLSNADILQLSLESDGDTPKTVNLSDFKQDLGLSGNNLSISSGNTVNLSEFKQSLSLSSNTLSISNNNSVNLNSFKQTLTLSGDELSISNGNFVDLNRAFTTSNGVISSQNNNDDFLLGANSLNHSSGDELKCFFDKSKGAFRMGKVTGSDWDEGNIGSYSFAIGEDSKASGGWSISMGVENDATGNYSTAIGNTNTASGGFSIALGSSNSTSGNLSVAIGAGNETTDAKTIAIGDNNNATDREAIAMGADNEAKAEQAIAIGTGTIASSFSEVALGMYNTTYSADNKNGFDNDDRILVVGKGSSANGRSDALRIMKDGQSYFFGAGAGVSDFAMTLDNTQNNNNNRNNGLLIIAGHSTYNGNQRSSFVEFESPDGDYCGRIRQGGNSSVNYMNSSDIRLKENIRPTQYGLQDILKIEVRDYNYKVDPDSHRQTGFIAQQLYTVFPTVVEEGGENPKIDPWTVDYGAVTPLLVKGIQDQQDIIQQQSQDIQRLQAELDEVKAALSTVGQIESQYVELKAMLEQMQTDHSDSPSK